VREKYFKVNSAVSLEDVVLPAEDPADFPDHLKMTPTTISPKISSLPFGHRRTNSYRTSFAQNSVHNPFRVPWNKRSQSIISLTRTTWRR
jgi:hypothetical protein